MKTPIQMVDLKGQYQKIKPQIDRAMQSVIDGSAFINGSQVKELQGALSQYLGCKHTITCGNGTDALQLALMALDLQPGDEVITPDFTFIATAEAIAFCGLTPIMVDVKPDTFTIDPQKLESVITPKTKAIICVNLFGQGVDFDAIIPIAKKHNLFIIEDNAQAFGAEYSSVDGKQVKLGTVGHIGCTSFFPSKNLGCFGDGGAIFTNDDSIAEKLFMIANHGSKKKYYHELIGVNSRLDTMQAAVLLEKLKHIDEYNASRCKAASWYDERLNGHASIRIPARQHNSTHVFHQYTLVLEKGINKEVQEALKEKCIPSMIYYPLTLHKQEAFKCYEQSGDFSTSVALETKVLSLPMHTELTEETVDFITKNLIEILNTL